MKQRSKVFICITLLLFFVFGLSLNTKAYDATCEVIVGGVVLNSENNMVTDANGGYVKKTLTVIEICNFTFSGEGYEFTKDSKTYNSALYIYYSNNDSHSEIEVKITGENTFIQTETTACDNVGIYTYCRTSGMKFTGGGTLIAKGGKSTAGDSIGFKSHGNCPDLREVTINAYGGEAPTGNSVGIWAEGLKKSEGTKRFIYSAFGGTGKKSYGMYIDGAINVANIILNATGGEGIEASYGMYDEEDGYIQTFIDCILDFNGGLSQNGFSCGLYLALKYHLNSASILSAKGNNNSKESYGIKSYSNTGFIQLSNPYSGRVHYVLGAGKTRGAECEIEIYSNKNGFEYLYSELSMTSEKVAFTSSTRTVNTSTLKTVKCGDYDHKLVIVTGRSDPYRLETFNYEGVYDNTEHTGMALGYYYNDTTITYGLKSGECTLTSAPTFEEPGTYTVYVKLQTNMPSVEKSFTVKISKKEISYNYPYGKTNIYDTNLHELIDSPSIESGRFEYSLDGENWSTEVPKGINAGQYSIMFRIVDFDSTHYVLSNNLNSYGTFTGYIEGAEITNPSISFDVVSLTQSYDGNAKAPILTSISGTTVDGSDVYPVYIYDNQFDTYISKEFPEFSAAGTYTILVRIGADNHNNASDDNLSSITFIIEKALSSYTELPKAKELYYTSNSQELVDVGQTSTGTIYYSLDGTNFTEEIPTGTTVGEYTVYYKIVGDSNHNDSEVSSFKVNIKVPNKDSLVAEIAKVNSYKESIGSAYPLYVTNIEQLVNSTSLLLDNDNVTQTELDEAIASLEAIISSTRKNIVIDLINDIGEVTYSKTSEEKLNLVRISYNDLTSEEKQLVTNYNTYVTGVNTYINLKAHALVTAIGTIDGSKENKENIDAADEYINGLTEEEASAINNLSDLKEALSIAKELYPVKKVDKDILDISGHIEYTNTVKTKLTTIIHEYESLSNSQKALVSNLELLLDAVEEYSQLELNANRHSIADKLGGVEIETSNGLGIPIDINLKVEIKSEVSFKNTKDYSYIEGKLEKGELIKTVFDVKLIQTINGEEKEVQPSDIQSGLKIKVKMVIPADVLGTNFRILHIHSKDDIESIEDYEIDGHIAIIEVSRLSEFAIVIKNDSDSLLWLILLLTVILLGVICFLSYVLALKFNSIKENKAYSFSPLFLLFLAYSEGQVGAVIVLASVIILLLAIIVFIILFDDNVRKKLFSKKVEKDNSKQNNVVKQKVEPKKETKPEEKVEEPKEEAKTEENKEEPKEEAKTEENKEEPKEEAKPEEKKEEQKEEAKPEENKEEPKEEAKPEENKEEPKEEAKTEENKEEPKEETKPEEKAEEPKAKPKSQRKKKETNKDSEPNNDMVEVKHHPIVEVKQNPIVEVKNHPVTVIKEEEDTSDEEDEVVVVKENNITYKIRYQKSFKAKLALADDELRNNYNILKNEILSYKKTTTRISFAYDSINLGKNQLLKFVIRGKTLSLYFALDPKEYIDSKYKVEESTSKRYELVSCMYKITSERRLNYAKELMAILGEKYNLEKEETDSKDYLVPKEEKDSLIEKGLIKVIKTKVEK